MQLMAASPPFIITKHFLILALLLLLLFHISATAHDEEFGYSGKEKDALYALKTTLNYPFLNDNWIGPHCINQTSNWHGIQCSDTGHVTGITLESMSALTGNIKLDAFINFTELSVLSFKNNSLWGKMMNFSSNQKLTHIDVSGNIFYGQISPSLLSLGMLESLLLQDNQLSGPIPEFNQSTLRTFDVSNNNLIGSIPTTQALKQFVTSDSFSGNPGLCGPPSPITCKSRVSDSDPQENPKNDSAHQHPNSTSQFNFYFFLLDVSGLIAVIFLFLLYYKKSRKLKKMMKELESTKQMNGHEIKTDDQKKMEEGEVAISSVTGQDHKGKLVFVGDREAAAADQFELGDLLKASAEGLGKGTFGNCYKAKMVNGKQAVVVKRIRDLKPLVSEEFTKQLQVIANLKHPNLLPLLSYYCTKDEKLLLYRYVPNENLFNRMFGQRGPDRIAFGWSSRLSVAKGVARALEYLHINAATSSNNSAAPHGNLKSSNVLLAENDTVLVSDYGFASLVALPIATQRMASYKSPEYKKTKKVSKESDVWSYGSLLLELLTGKISACTAPPGVNGVDLCSLVHRAVREEWTAEIFDLEITVCRTACSGMLRLLQIAMRCCEISPERRPGMREVVREVENIRVAESEVDQDDLSVEQSPNG